MKKLVLAVALMGFMGSASATGLSIVDESATFGISDFGLSPDLTGPVTSGSFGTLFADVAGTITFTYIGQDSDFRNRFALVVDGPNLRLNESDVPGVTNVSSSIGSGLVKFRFVDLTSDRTINNGELSTAAFGFAFLDVTQALPNEFYIGFNDAFDGDADYDDFVVKASFVSAVPVPAALPLMATALGLFGFGASRRRV